MSKKINIIRVIATIFIVLCHIFQYYNFVLAWWFNVGVQIFFFLSGYLQGYKKQDKPIIFYKKRAFRILLPYYIYLSSVLIVYLLFNPSLLNFKSIIYSYLLLQAFTTPISGLAHLWFITYITIAYLITPIIYRFNISNNKIFTFYGTLLLIIFSLYIFKPLLGIYVGLYIFGYFYSKRYNNSRIDEKKKIDIIILTLAAIFNIFKIMIQYNFLKISSLDFMLNLSLLSHAFLGIAIFIILFKYLDYKSQSNSKIIILINNASYNIYLSHHILILGSLSVLSLTTNIIINYIILLIGIIISVWYINIITFLYNKIFKIEVEE